MSVDAREAELDRMIGGLNMEYVTLCGESIRGLLLLGKTVGIDYQPGNMTRYELVLAPCGHVVTLPHPGGVRVVPDGFGESLAQAVLVSHLNGRHNACWAVALLGRGDDWLAPWYVEEKLRVNFGDAVALIALFAAIADNPFVLYGGRTP